MLGIIIYGWLTAQTQPKLWKEYTNKRSLATIPFGAHTADVRIKQLQHEPKLSLYVTGVSPRSSMSVWLFDAQRRLRPYRVPEQFRANRRGEIKAEVPLPSALLQNYETVVGLQDGRTIFHAPLL